jgi:antitoxin VapB
MATARVFRSGNSQAVRLPKEFRLKGKEVEVFRRGDEIVLREKGKGLARAFEILASLPLGDRHDTPPQDRNGVQSRTTKASFDASRG